MKKDETSETLVSEVGYCGRSTLSSQTGSEACYGKVLYALAFSISVLLATLN
jgi:hypothetical protein